MLNVFSLTWTMGSQGKIKGRTMHFEILETVGKRLGQAKEDAGGLVHAKKNNSLLGL